MLSDIDNFCTKAANYHLLLSTVLTEVLNQTIIYSHTLTLASTL